MFLRCTQRKKDGKIHRYWSIVENKRVRRHKVVQRHVLYLGEINNTQKESWEKTIEIFEDGQTRPKTVALFPEDQVGLIKREDIVQIRLGELALRRPRQWGGCWLAQEIYQQLELDQFWARRLAPSRKGTRWDLVLQTLVTYRLLDPGSEWRLHRTWYERSAMADLLGEDFGLAEIHKLYDCHDLILSHKKELFEHLNRRWKDLFNASFEVLLYDLTSTYFESDPPFPEGDKRRHGYSRDHRPDCVQVVVGLIVTPEGFPLAYEVLAGNTNDKTTLGGFLEKIEQQYGQARRIWVMDRGIPTEEVLEEMRTSDPPIHYLVGTPKGRLGQYEKELSGLSWQTVREGVEVKLLPQSGEVYVLAQSRDRVNKERAMRRRQLKKLWKRLKELSSMKIKKRDDLLLKLGAAREQSPSAWRLVDIVVAKDQPALSFSLRKDKLREVRCREGRYLLRTNLPAEDPELMWRLYMQLNHVEEAFKNLKGDLALRPIYHQNEDRIEAHIFVAFLAYCLHVTLNHRADPLAPGLTPRSILEKFSAIQMIDVHIPTTDGREVLLTRYTQPESEHQILLHQLKLQLPAQPPPKIKTLQPAPT